jgi:uncharacterized protein
MGLKRSKQAVAALLRRYTVAIGTALLISSCASVFPTGGAKSTLWKAHGDHNTVYLLGSIHVLPLSAYPLHPALQRAFNDSSQIVFEVDLSAISQRDVLQEFQQVGVYPPGDDLAHHVSPATLTILKIVLAKLDISYEQAKRYKPGLLAELITSRYTELAGFREDLGVDHYFYAQAKATHKPVLGLETVRDQARVLNADDTAGERDLIEAIANLPASKAVLDELVRAWKYGRINKLDRLLNQDEREDPKSFEAMFARRNQKWLPQVERFLHADKNYLVIVGSGHLVGDHGLVRALQDRGYRVDQL